MEINKITAREARELTNSAEYVLNEIYELIRDSAKRSQEFTYWLMDKGISMNVVNNIIVPTLKEDGYGISFDGSLATIRW